MISSSATRPVKGFHYPPSARERYRVHSKRRRHVVVAVSSGNVDLQVDSGDRRRRVARAHLNYEVAAIAVRLIPLSKEPTMCNCLWFIENMPFGLTIS